MRKLLVYLALAALAVGLAAVAVASPPQTASGTFAVATLTPTGSRTAGGNTILTFTRTATLTGTYSGTTTDEITLVLHKDGSANIHGAGVCACTVEGRTGTSEYRFQGRGTFPTQLEGHYVIGHGTGGLEGLHGQGPFSGNFFAVVYGGQYHFDPS